MLYNLQIFETECSTVEEEECYTKYEEKCEPTYKVKFNKMTGQYGVTKFGENFATLAKCPNEAIRFAFTSHMTSYGSYLV